MNVSTKVNYDVWKDEWNTRFIAAPASTQSTCTIQAVALGTIVSASKRETDIINKFLNRKSIKRHFKAPGPREVDIDFGNDYNLPPLVVMRTKENLICIIFKIFNISNYIKSLMTKNKDVPNAPYVE
jgi:hypothetical protein